MAPHGDDEHERDHDKTFQPDEEESLGHYGIAEMAVRELDRSSSNSIRLHQPSAPK